MGLLNHASAKGDYASRLYGFEFFKGSDIAEHPVLGVFPYGACYKYHRIGIVGILAYRISHVLKHTFYMLAVADVLLATVGMYKGFGRDSLSFGKVFLYKSAELLLTG